MSAAQDIARVVRESAQVHAEQAGLVVEDVTARAAGGRQLVTVTLDLPEDEIGSAELDTIAEVSRAVSQELDGRDDVPDVAYVLEMTTPGADRPLTQKRHFKRARTRLVVVSTTDGDQMSGRLVQVDDAGLVLETNSGEQTLDWSAVAKGKVELEFSRS